MVVAQHCAESLASFDWDVRLDPDTRRNQQPIAQPSMIAFTMIVGQILSHRVPQRRFSHKDHPTQTFFLDGANKPLRERV
jgi:hypothetical protein